jgi:NAD(P)-dependent dehydrogenase (short-subunit alcohol dehydrogenase family)
MTGVERVSPAGAPPVAIVVGAGSGLGRATALELARRGVVPVLCARHREGIDAAVAQIQAAGGTGHAFPADAADEGAVAQLFGYVRERFGRLDVLVCSVGEGLKRPILETTLPDLTAQISANLVPVYLTNRAAVRVMTPQGSGVIVNIASRAAFVGANAPLALYTAAKMAVVGFSQALGREVRRSGINVLCLAPSPMDTPSRWRSSPEFDRRRVMSPDKVAGLIAYVAQNPDFVLEGTVVPAALSF